MQSMYSGYLIIASLASCFLVAFPEALAQSSLEPFQTATIQKRAISFETALAIAQVALKAGRAAGHDVAVTVADNAGLPLVVLRADNATEQFFNGSQSRAWTAVNMKSSTRDLVGRVKEGKQDNALLPFIDKSLLLMGGVPLKYGDTIVGGVGVSGCPYGPDNDAVAQSAAKEFARLLQK